MFFKYDCNTMLLMKGTAASFVQSNDPSAEWSVARGAAGGLLNEKLIHEQRSDVPCLDIQTTP